jgi:hypothetical protein
MQLAFPGCSEVEDVGKVWQTRVEDSSQRVYRCVPGCQLQPISEEAHSGLEENSAHLWDVWLHVEVHPHHQSQLSLPSRPKSNRAAGEALSGLHSTPDRESGLRHRGVRYGEHAGRHDEDATAWWRTEVDEEC